MKKVEASRDVPPGWVKLPAGTVLIPGDMIWGSVRGWREFTIRTTDHMPVLKDELFCRLLADAIDTGVLDLQVPADATGRNQL